MKKKVLLLYTVLLIKRTFPHQSSMQEIKMDVPGSSDASQTPPTNKTMYHTHALMNTLQIMGTHSQNEDQ